jgi:RNA polymerase-binding transcription factor DksA
MKHLEMTEQPSLNFYQDLLLKRFGALRRQRMTADVKMEEERIELALKRIDWGNYRSCLTCGEDIEDGRLLADPTTIYCGKCNG